ncbi:transposase family protein (plasmid) [Flammeovirga sp. MY04]|uniref:DDE-type integrase/transposase/recombinase n=1 Tax=Flammeovirga sp. MY04 TaxID=1191459 RepID=UPI00082656CD|nr:DDE-type integrase/transposase/recombinase [Flammeovirga sp. MY04]QJD09397.1 transposase family protein [Flammeovirga sp. MY04]
MLHLYIEIYHIHQDALYKRFSESEIKEMQQSSEEDRLQFLHDNGPEYIENKLVKSLNEWGVQNCNTPTYSPQSNGMCESFIYWDI